MARGVASQDGGRSRWRQGHNWRRGDSKNRTQGQVESFFIYNFPEEWDAKALWYQYQRHGKVVDVFIPSKRDRWGKRFGFVRMRGVQDVKQLEERLNRIWIGSYKLRARVASSKRQQEIRSQRNAGKKSGTDRVQRRFEQRRSARLKEGIREQRFVQPGLSYVQVVMGDSRKHSDLVLNKQEEKKEKSAAMDRISIIQRKSASLEGKSSEEKEGAVNSRINREEIIEFSPLKEENEWLQGSMIVVVKSMSMISTIQERLDVDGGLINISPLGGRTILLTERLAGYLNEYLLQHKELFELWCEKIHSWDEAPQNYGRMVWVRISGVPLKAWSKRCFEMIAASLGEVVLVHEDTKSKSILCDGRVMILCSERNKIVKTLKLKVEEKLYQIGVTEEEWRADPDWWLSEDDRREEVETISDVSSSEQGEEDHKFNHSVIRGDDVDDVEETDGERIEAEGISNSKKGAKTESRGSAREENKELDGLNNQKGLKRDAEDGPEEEYGLNVSISHVQETRDSGNGPKSLIGNLGDVQGQIEGELNNGAKSGTRDLREKKKKDLKDCYPQEKLAGVQNGAEVQDHRAGSSSLSDGCIAHRNKVIRREMHIQEVRRIFNLGKRSGIEVDDNDGEVQSRLMELEETKLEMVQGNLCKMMWFSDEFDWVMKESVGASGGLLCVWNRIEFVKQKDFSGDGFVGISGEWGQQKLKCNLVNVYAPNDRQKKLKLWEELRHMIVEEEGGWLIAGDFNAVRSANEKKGKVGETMDMRDFDDFIVSAGLVDLKLANRRFTWYRPDGSAMSRLDRVLMSDELCNLGKEWVQQGLKRTVSDHCPIMVKTSTADWGPKPFRVFDAWQQHPQFRKAVEDKWKELNVEGYAGYRCLKKLKRLKEFLKGWNKEVFGNMEAQFSNVAETVERLDLKNEVADLEGSEVKQRKEGFQQIWDMLRLREAIWKQKSRSEWVKLGDQNTRYFHKVANGRKAINSIQGIKNDGQWVEEPAMVKKEVLSYFRKMFQEDCWVRPKPSNIVFKKISEEQMVWLERPFSVEEIEEGLKSCDGSKAPGPDGYNLNFLKFFWNSIKDDFVAFFHEFHQSCKLVKGLNSSFLTLIPKKLNPRELKDFRPISLIGCVYKILSKVLANRLKNVMSEIISETQSAFIGGRQLVDSVLVLNEVVDEVRNRKTPAFVFKADFQKAYDCVNWTYLDWMMERFGFGAKWKGWIKECLSTARCSVLVNGSPTEEFELERGLRQGDPLSPFLFLMIMEGLNGLVKKAESEGLLQGIEIGKKGLTVSLLQFADDTVILGRADSENILTVKAILRWFEIMSGLRINYSKSSIHGFNVKESWVRGAVGTLRCESFVVNLPSGNLPCCPLAVASRYFSRVFLWGGGVGGNEEKRKISWVKWEDICGSKVNGGLGVPDLNRRNWALLGKWWYRLGDGKEGLWKRVVLEKYYGGGQEVNITDVEKLRVSKIWGDILRIGGKSNRLKTMLVKGFKWEVGDGSRVGFWRQIWAGNNALRDSFPRLFQLATNKEGMVQEYGFWEGDSWKWEIGWRRKRMGREQDEEKELWKVLGTIQLRKYVGDYWKWRYDVEGRLVPFKVSIFGWRLCLDRLPTRRNLQKRGVTFQEDNTTCGLCKKGVEEVDHLFCTCMEAWVVWAKTIKWWGMELVMPDTVKGVAETFIYGLGSLVGKEMGVYIFLVTAWYLWYRRNVLVFRREEDIREQLLELIQVKTHFWKTGPYSASIIAPPSLCTLPSSFSDLAMTDSRSPSAATKHHSPTKAEAKAISSLYTTGRTMVFAYGVTFAFVACTAFLVLNPSSNSSPWIKNFLKSLSSSSRFSSLFSSFVSNSSQTDGNPLPSTRPPAAPFRVSWESSGFGDKNGFKPARSVSIRRILASISDLPQGSEPSPSARGARSPLPQEYPIFEENES
ncbi:hypothetical protein SLEP1_g42745 [Rubroshorea leprosula]|uniref:Uncharacterized protein n=1 Tax=Rubroshorea leprosula TaxID=152421 RepID=A0AAV5LB77_9ROSI|nr:hypothetical protein SLEP1_g42745 [Rubroshorea leprosula]